MKKLRFLVAGTLALVWFTGVLALGAAPPASAEQVPAWRPPLAAPADGSVELRKIRLRLRDLEAEIQRLDATSGREGALGDPRIGDAAAELMELRGRLLALDVDPDARRRLLRRVDRSEGRALQFLGGQRSPGKRALAGPPREERRILERALADRDHTPRMSRSERMKPEAALRRGGREAAMEESRARNSRPSERLSPEAPARIGPSSREYPGALRLDAPALAAGCGSAADDAAWARLVSEQRRLEDWLAALRARRAGDRDKRAAAEPTPRPELERLARELADAVPALAETRASEEAGAVERRLAELRNDLRRLQRGEPVPSPAGGVDLALPAAGLAGLAALVPGMGDGTIGGTVTDAATGLPISSGGVDVYDAAGLWVDYSQLDCAGRYQVADLTPGTYYANTYTWNASYIDELYDDIPCEPYCTPVAGTPIAVTAGATATADFALDFGGSVSGIVTDATTGLPIGGVSVDVWNSAGDYAGGASTDVSGTYTVGGLVSGDYYARASDYYDRWYLTEQYDDVACWAGCPNTSGDPITVVMGSATTAIDFALESGGSLTGRVTDVFTGGAAAPNVSVQLYDAAGTHQGNFYASLFNDGVYSSDAVPAGTYYLRTASSFDDQLFDGIDCSAGCTVTSGTPVVVTVGAQTTGVDFALGAGSRGSIEGVVTDGLTGLPLPWTRVEIFDSTGTRISYPSFYADEHGRYAWGALIPGQYFVRTADTDAYTDELWDDMPCEPTCDPLTGTPVTVVEHAVTTADFGLASPGRGALSGTVADSVSGAPLAGVRVEVYDAGGSWLDQATTDAAGLFAFGGLLPGSYHVRTQGTDTHADELYDDVRCWDRCRITNGTPVAVAAGAETTGVDFALEPGGRFAGAVTDATSGLPVRVSVHALDATGDFLSVSAYPDFDGTYLSDAVPAGTYFVRTFGEESYLGQLFDELPCPFGCDETTGTPVVVAAGAITPGIDFPLVIGGTIEGTIVDAATGAPILGGSVWLTDSSGSYNFGTSVNPCGRYVAGPLPTGDYFIGTGVGHLGYLDELHQDLPCWNGCDATSGDPVAVVVGAATTVDFALDKGGSITGVVTEDPSGSPIANTNIRIFDVSGNWVSDGFTDATGAYESRALPTGTFFVATSDYSGAYLDELFDDLPCEPYCSATTGTPVAVVQGLPTPGIDFALARAGSITGIVTDVDTGAPLPDVEVAIFDPVMDDYVAYGYTDATGAYSAGGLTGGTFYARTYDYSGGGYLDELFDDLPCATGCDETTGAPIAVVQGAATPGVDFALEKGGAFSGILTDEVAGTPISNAYVRAYDAAGNWAGNGWPNGAGEYTVAGLPAGSYFARVINWSGYLDELYDDLPCWNGCDETAGTPIPVVKGATTPGIDFALVLGGEINGVVTDSVTGAPIADVGIDVYDAAGDYAAYGYTDATGAYVAPGLPTGTFHALTYNDEGYLDELYDDLPCWYDCTITDGDPIAVTAGSSTSGVDFALDEGGSIAGMVTDAVSGAAVTSGYVVAYDALGNWIRSDWMDGSGAYELPGLADGTYFVRTNADGGYLNELFDDLLCEPYCDETTGTPVVVLAGVTTSGIDFALDKGGSIAGVVTDEATGAPITNGWVSVYDTNGNWVGSDSLDGSGAYEVGGLTPFDYLVRVSNDDGYLDELWDDIPCWSGCSIWAGDPVPVAAGTQTSGIDFALTKGGSIAGLAVDAATGAPVAGAWVDALDSSGNYWNGDTTDGTGAYHIVGLPPETYYLILQNSSGYIDEYYDGTPVAGQPCERLGTIPITVGPAEDVVGIDFTLEIGAVLSGSVIDSTSGAGIDGVEIEIFDTAGGYYAYAYTDATGAFTTGASLPPGGYYVSTYNYDGYLDELYDDLPCWDGCNLEDGFPVVVAAGPALLPVDFALDPSGSITGAVTDEVTGAPLTQGRVYLWDAAGDFIDSQYLYSSNVYTFDGLASGDYYVGTRLFDGHLDELYGGLPCAAAQCDPTIGTPVAVTAGAVTAGIDLALGLGGSISGAVTDAATASPLSAVGVYVYDANDAYVGYAYPDATGAYTVTGLPAGSLHAATLEYPQGPWVDELYDDVPCPYTGCDLSTGTGIPVTLGADTAGIDFALDVGGSITGRVTDAMTGGPLAAVLVRAYGPGDAFAGWARTDGNGDYTIPGLSADLYVVLAWPQLDYTPELSGGVPCPTGACDRTTGVPLAVTLGAATTVDFALDADGAIEGAVTDVVTAVPLHRARVSVYDAAGFYFGDRWVDSCGEYEVYGLAAGSYLLHTKNAQHYLDEVFDDLPCAAGACDPLGGTPVMVIGGGDAIADFALYKRGLLTGRVVDHYSGAPLGGVCVDVWDAVGGWVDQACTAANGYYRTDLELPAASYHASTGNALGYDDELFHDYPCPGGVCDKTAGDAIPAGPGLATAVDFALGATCYTPMDLVLSHRSIDTFEVFESSSSLTVTEFWVNAPGGVTLRTDGTLTLGDGFSVWLGAEMALENGPVGGCPP